MSAHDLFICLCTCSVTLTACQQSPSSTRPLAPPSYRDASSSSPVAFQGILQKINSYTEDLKFICIVTIAIMCKHTRLHSVHLSGVRAMTGKQFLSKQGYSFHNALDFLYKSIRLRIAATHRNAPSDDYV